jgi:diguanylate cyclase (GGDEF)-like protein
VRDDEIGELSSALNQLTQRIKNHMDDLKIYGERTKDINLQVNKQVVALSGLLQVSNLIAKGTELKDIFEITMARLSQVANSSLAFLIFQNEENFTVKAQFGLSDEASSDIESPGNTYLFKGICSDKPYLKIDKTSSDVAAGELLRVLKAKNVLIFPIMVQKIFKGLLGMGNHVADFEYSEDDVELLNIFAKQLSIAVENDLLVRRVEDLEVRDGLTGLYNRRYLTARLEEEVLRAISHQRPCAFIIVKIKNLKDIQLQSGEQIVEEDLKKVASELKAYGGEIDRVGRIGHDEFGIVLPEKNKRRAQDLAFVIKDKMQAIFAGVERRKKPEIQTSVVENPIDGSDAVSLIEKAKMCLEVAEGGL